MPRITGDESAFGYLKPEAEHDDVKGRHGREAEAEAGGLRQVPSYEEFRTGLTFRQVRAMLWVQSNDPKDWKYKRRNTVLGLWRQIKREMYAELCAWADSYDDTKGTA